MNTYKFQSYIPNATAVRFPCEHKGGNSQVQMDTAQQCDTGSKQVNSVSPHAAFGHLPTESVGEEN